MKCPLCNISVTEYTTDKGYKVIVNKEKTYAFKLTRGTAVMETVHILHSKTCRKKRNRHDLN